MRLKPTRPQAKTAIGLLLATAASFLLTSCSTSNISGMGFEKNLSSVNDTSLSLWQGAWITAGVVGVFTAILILWPAFRHRRKGDEIPKQSQYNIPTEVAYTLIPFIIVAVLFYFTAKDESKITKVTTVAAAAHNVTINAIQWSWQFTYNDIGDKATVTGTPAQPPTLVLPQGESVRFKLTASDVVHGFWIPAFMIQMQNLPGVENHLQFTANKIGEYPGRCNILCGRNHSQMLFKVKVVSAADYKTYLSTLKAA
jgi:cytochrome c oxidase subunit 2